MKRNLTIIGCLLLLVTLLGILTPAISRPGFDFSLRMNEVQCLRAGADPYDVSVEKRTLAPYWSIDPAHPNPDPVRYHAPIGVYPPWAYTFAMPLSYLPRQAAWSLYLVSLVAALGLLIACGYALGKSVRGSKTEGWLVAALPLLLMGYPLWSNALVGNWAVHNLALVVVMAWCLSRGRDLLAGVCWAFLMVKPQVGLIFAVPLLLAWKWRTGLVAGALCLAASVPAAKLCGKSVVEMILETPGGSSYAFGGCGTWPVFCCGWLPGSLDILVGLLIGVVVCAVMTKWLRVSASESPAGGSFAGWLHFSMPAAMVSCLWSYANNYSHLMGWLLLVFVLLEVLRGGGRSWFWVLVLAVPTAGRAFNAVVSLGGVSGLFPPVSARWFRFGESVSSLFVLLLLLSVTYRRRAVRT